MVNIRRWISCMLLLVLLTQCIPLNVLAETMNMITEAEIQEALLLASLQPAAGWNDTDESSPLRLEMKESRYHKGMGIDETWDAPMMLDWLDSMLKTELYNVAQLFSQAETNLERMQTENPADYLRYTCGENEKFVKDCHQYAIDLELAEETTRFLRTRLQENITEIQLGVEMLVNSGENLFEHEKIRVSAQIRNAVRQLKSVMEDTILFGLEQIFVLMTGEAIVKGEIEPEFSAWLKELVNTTEEPVFKSVSLQHSDAFAGNTLLSRLTPVSSALASSGSNDVVISVLKKNQFAIVIHGVDNKPLSGVSVTIKDLNNGVVKTVKTTDPELGIATFETSDFVCDYDQEMELSMTVDGSAVGYESFSIPWMLMKMGGKRTEVLNPLQSSAQSGMGEAKSFAVQTQQKSTPASTKTSYKPYVYSCTFNDMDIWRTNKKIRVSALNDTEFDFAIEVVNASGQEIQAPLLCYWTYTGKTFTGSLEKKVMSPTSSVKVDGLRTRYVYRNKWKQILAPDIKWNQNPYFVFPDTNQEVHTLASPVRSKVDQPNIAGTGVNSPLRKVLGDGFGLGFTIPTIKANVGLNIPSAEYLPKVVIDGYDYITVTMGSTMVEPKKMNWKNTEQERYDKGMKQYQHETSVAGRKQMMGMASKYYKYMGADHQSMKKLSTKIGFFFMLSGRLELSDPDDGSTYWNAGGTAGLTVVISFDYTWPFAIGPVPFYANLNFSAAAGFGGGIAVRVWMAKDGSYRNFDFDLAGITISIRLALTVSLGLGIKGVASVWVSATGALNVMLQFVKNQPVHIAVFLEVNVAVGFEFFFITYSQIIWSMNNIEIYKNYKEAAGYSFFNFLTAYAAEKEKSVRSVEMTPETYSQLAPAAKKVMTNSESTLSGIKVVEAGGETYAFMIGPYTDEHGKTCQRVTCLNLKNGKREVLKYGNSPVSTDGNDYAFDVFSDGRKIALVACFARKMEKDGSPAPNMPHEFDMGGSINYSEAEQYASNLIYAAILSPDSGRDGALTGERSDNYAIYRSRTGYNVATNPKIESMTGANNTLTITGSVDAFNSVFGVKGFVSFRTNSYDGNPLSTIDLESDQSVQRAQGDPYEIVEMRSDPFGKAAIDYGHQYGDCLVRSNGFIALTRPKNQAAGDHVIELFDYDMNVAPVDFRGVSDRDAYTEVYSNPQYAERVIVRTLRKAIPLDSGDIDKMEVINSKGARTIFYTKTVQADGREEKRLKSIYLSPKKGAGTKNISYDLTYTDYDLSIQSGDFRAVTLGASQYLYWLSTAPREKKSDPVTWRITGVYYDSSTGSVSDEIVIAEFALPESPYNGKNYPSVPYDIILTESGMGYITAKPNAGKEKMNGTLPLTLYSFPISLKPVGVLKGAAVMDNVVTQGDFVTTDIAMMNEGNMGIGGFILEVVLIENGKEKAVVETMYANCLDPQNSRIVMSDGTTVLKGEKVLYRYKDFIYSPKQREWIVNTQNSGLSVANGYTVSKTKGTESVKRVATNVLVPGALGGFSGNIKIPSDWAGKYRLRLRVKEVSTYPNWIAASALAEKRPELFALVDSGDLAGMRKKANALMEAVRNPLERQAVQSLTYRLDASGRQMVLARTPLLMGALAANGSGFPGIPGLPVQLFAAGAAEGTEEGVLLYPTAIDAPAAVDLDVNVHDINVSHRVYRDYYGEQMLEITIGNYLNNEQSIRLRCMVYEDDSLTGRMFYLPTDADMVSANTTQTITLPLSSLVDPLTHEKVRVVFTGIGIDDSIATFNNEFTIYLGGTIPEPVPALPDTGDNGHLLLWAGLFVAGLGAVILTGIVRSRKRRK